MVSSLVCCLAIFLEVHHFMGIVLPSPLPYCGLFLQVSSCLWASTSGPRVACLSIFCLGNSPLCVPSSCSGTILPANGPPFLF